MILGMGVDLVDVRSFSSQLSDTASHFVRATFTDAEVAYSRGASSGEPDRHLAARFAAKEATLKALDQACARAGVTPEQQVSLRSIEVRRDVRGRPHLDLHGEAAALATRVGVDRAWVSLSHDGNQALASVVVERIA